MRRAAKAEREASPVLNDTDIYGDGSGKWCVLTNVDRGYYTALG